MRTFTKNQSVFIDGVEHKVVRTNADTAQLESQITGEFKSERFVNLMRMYTTGRLKVQCAIARLQQPRRNAPSPETCQKPVRSKAALADSRRIVNYIQALKKEGFVTGSKKLNEMVMRISAQLGDVRPPHLSTIYNWLRKFNSSQGDIRAVISNYDARGGRGKTRLPSEVERVIDARIEKVLLEPKAGTAESVYIGVLQDIRLINSARIESEHLKNPGLRTIQRRIKDLWAYDFALARFGRAEADRRFGMYLGARKISRILEMVEIDHSPLDILVVDQNHVVIGRPSITVIIDRKSRCILGFHISLAGHGTQAVFECLRHALLPKMYLQEGGAYADMKLDWPCFGWFSVVVMDNGREFHAESVVDALLNIGISTEYAPSRDPNSKPHVERFLRTLNYGLIHTLPGTTLAKVHHRIGFKSEDEACLSLEQLDRIVHRWVCEVYHLRPHRGLDRRAPLTVWNEGVQAHPPELKLNHDEVEIEFSEVQTSAVQHYGIDLNTFVYVSHQLLQLRRTLPNNTKVTVKAPLHDAGHIWVWDPHGSQYFKVPNKDNQYAGLTMLQAKAAKKFKAEAGSAYARTGALAMDVVRAEASEAQRHQKLAVRRAGAKFADRTSARTRKSRAAPDGHSFAPMQSPPVVFTSEDDEESPMEIVISLPREVSDVI